MSEQEKIPQAEISTYLRYLHETDLLRKQTNIDIISQGFVVVGEQADEHTGHREFIMTTPSQLGRIG